MALRLFLHQAANRWLAVPLEPVPGTRHSSRLQKTGSFCTETPRSAFAGEGLRRGTVPFPSRGSNAALTARRRFHGWELQARRASESPHAPSIFSFFRSAEERRCRSQGSVLAQQSHLLCFGRVLRAPQASPARSAALCPLSPCATSPGLRHLQGHRTTPPDEHGVLSPQGGEPGSPSQAGLSLGALSAMQSPGRPSGFGSLERECSELISNRSNSLWWNCRTMFPAMVLLQEEATGGFGGQKSPHRRILPSNRRIPLSETSSPLSAGLRCLGIVSSGDAHRARGYPGANPTRKLQVRRLHLEATCFPTQLL